ncbi:MAG: glutathione peroxidase [Pseudomonadota bacterium]
MFRRTFLLGSGVLAGAAVAHAGSAACSGFTFASIDGGTLALGDWLGQPVLVTNTASLCGFTFQYEALQTLYDTYRARGLVVLAVPSDDFAQELGTAEEVRAFCEVNYGLDLPMADITPVLGPGAHPFYRWLAESHGVRPRWNFNKVLIGPDGSFLEFWGSHVSPTSAQITTRIEALLPR